MKENTFGEILKRLRKQRGISQDELAKLIGVSRTVISSYECDKSKPKFEHIVPISKALNVSLNTLFNVISIMEFLYITRDRLKKSDDVFDRNIALYYDFIIGELEIEKNRIEKIRKDN